MPWNVTFVKLFFALGDVLLVLTEPVRTAIIQIGKASVVEGEKVEFKCVTSAVHEEQPENKERNWFHLYKNREKISSLPEPGGMGAVTFIKQDIRKNDTGNYTCMYGNKNPGDVKNNQPWFFSLSQCTRVSLSAPTSAGQTQPNGSNGCII